MSKITLSGPQNFGFIEALLPLRPLGETFGAELLDLAGDLLDILNQHAEMVDTAEVEPRPLVPAEMQNRQAQGPVAEEHIVGSSAASTM